MPQILRITGNQINLKRPQKALIKSINRVKEAWQTIWTKFNITRDSFDYILSGKNQNFEIALANTEPTVHKEIMIMLSFNSDNEIRIWARANRSLFKARIAERLIKWEDVEKVSTKSKPTWWLYAIKNADLYQEEDNNYAKISRPDTYTTDY